MDDLITWLRAQLDELANGGKPDLHTTTCGYTQVEFVSDECTCGVPARVLREVEAKRGIITACESVLADSDTVNGYSDGISPAWLAVRTLKSLALPFSDRPGYQESWRP